MDIRNIKNTREIFWTNHSKYKLLQYNLSPTMVKKVMNHPERTEEGVAPNTTAIMKRKDTKSMKREVWVMIQKFGSKKRIISTWIYPGVSPKGKEIYIPEDVWEGINE